MRLDCMFRCGLVFDTQHLAAQHTMMGDGLALLDPLLFHEEIKAGRLVRRTTSGSTKATAIISPPILRI